jgi:hypothetical protein
MKTIQLMTFTEDQIEQFKQLYFKRHGKEIGNEDAYEQASKLVRLVMLIYKPMADEDFEAIQNRRLERMPEIVEHIASHIDIDVVQ